MGLIAANEEESLLERMGLNVVNNLEFGIHKSPHQKKMNKKSRYRGIR